MSDLEQDEKPTAWTPTHRHRKGGFYRVLMEARRESDLVNCVIYDDAAGNAWIRPVNEFNDGRFAPLSDIPS